MLHLRPSVPPSVTPLSRGEREPRRLYKRSRERDEETNRVQGRSPHLLYTLYGLSGSTTWTSSQESKVSSKV
ncbi:hypothetical protein EYF80_056311 [Liparis tanakae]|uniref:Uncharacterized protein n=1 Tax=Liparis tanakae TaxID=230148 RepID=A0A4Z2EX69_9TELE|nr:hypothetical protein EYF80_056311 [Liparis tanakae]